ncbi:hypothetical protein JXA12_00165 [Candidatus Woesearchaeota archaeon]|nr:hypothetical protein [Candidatus Woesearchaeota archaeon]
MAKTVDLSLDSFKELWGDVVDYFTGLELLSLVAWGAIGLGVILVIVALIVW